MNFEKVKDILDGIPHTPAEDAKILYDLCLNENINSVLELGFQHGVSTCYMASAFNTKGSGKITTIDREINKTEKPSIYELMEKTGTKERVEVVFARETYVYELKKIIEANSKGNVCHPKYDFIFIDGAHNWETDGFAFFLADKLLKPGGWILFDDMNWTYESSPTLKETDLVKSMTKEEKSEAQVQKVFDLLVKQHPNYSDFIVKGRWGWAKKKAQVEVLSKDEILELYKGRSFKSKVKDFLKR